MSGICHTEAIFNEPRQAYRPHTRAATTAPGGAPRKGDQMLRRRLLATVSVTALLTTLLSVAGTQPALAAPPAGDSFADAQTLTFGDTVAIDTTEATVEDPLDRQAGDACPVPPGPPPSTVNTIWFEFTADATTPTEAAVFVDQAFWDAGVAVVTGTPGAFTGVACGPFLAVFNPQPGTTYHIMIFDFDETSAPNGGSAVLSFGEMPPAPELGLTVNATGTFNRATGTATISGTYECTNAFFVDIFGDVSQRVGRFILRGSFSTFGIECDGAVHPWSAEVFPENGTFAGGKALTVTIAFSCGIAFCSDAFVEQTVQLKGGARTP